MINCRSLFSRYYPYAVLTLVVVILYAPTLNNDFFNIDDEQYIVNNPYIKEVSWRNLGVIFHPFGPITKDIKAYRPILTISFFIDHYLGGCSPAFYHFGNLVLYIAFCLILYHVLKNHIGPAGFRAALFFSVHPVHTESVAWIAGRSDLLCGLFCLLSIYAYTKAEGSNATGIYVLSIFFWVLGFLSKPTAIVLPVVIIGYDTLVASKPWRSSCFRWIPFIVGAFSALRFTVSIARHCGHISEIIIPLSERLLYSALLVQRYIAASIAPIQLSFYYDPFPALPKIMPEVVLSLIVVVLIVVLGIVWLVRDRRALFLLILFMAFLLPVMQIIPFPIMQADRYLFFSVTALAIVFGRSAEAGLQKKGRTLALTAAIVVLGFFFSLSWQRIECWESSISVWKDAIKKSSGAFPVMQLGRAYFKENQYNHALAQFRTVITECPDHGDAYYWAGRSLMAAGNASRAESFFRKAKRIKNNHRTNYQLGLIAFQREDFTGALRYLKEAIALKPTFWEGYYLQGMIFLKLNNTEEAFRSLCASLHPTNKKYNASLKMIKKLGMGTCHENGQ